MRKTKRFAALLLVAMLLAQLLAGTALAAGETNEFMPKLWLAVDWSTEEQAGDLLLTAKVYFAFSDDPEALRAHVAYQHPVIETWLYIGDNFFTEEYALEGLPIYTDGDWPYLQLTMRLEDGASAYGLYAVCMHGNGYFCADYELHLDGWRPLRFDDVAHNSWYYPYVNYAANVLELVEGKRAGQFAPDDSISVAEAITLAARMRASVFGGLEDTAAAPGEPWFQPYLDYAAANGIPWEYENYGGPIARSDFVHIFYAALPEAWYTPINRVPDGAVPDVPMSAGYAGEIYSFYRAGILTGSADYSFFPYDEIKRSEVAAILCRMNGEGRQTINID